MKEQDDYEYEEPANELDEWAHKVIGAAIELHRVLGPGYIEEVYQKALQVELALRQIPFGPQSPIQVIYKGQNVGKGFVDLLVAGKLIVELKNHEFRLPANSLFGAGLPLPEPSLSAFRGPGLQHPTAGNGSCP